MKEHVEQYKQLESHWLQELYAIHPRDAAWKFTMERLVQSWVGMMSYGMLGYSQLEIEGYIQKLKERHGKTI